MVQHVKWGICLSYKIDLEIAKNFDILVCDGQNPPDLAPLLEAKKPLYAYTNIAQALKFYPYYQQAVDAQLILMPNPFNPEGSFLDLNNPKWQEFMCSTLIPTLVKKGFTGLFLEGLDIPIYIEDSEGYQYKGMKDSAVKLIQAIRGHFPELKLWINRGFQLADQIGSVIDGIVGEGIYSFYDWNKKSYEKRTEGDIQWQVQNMQKLCQKFQQIQPYSIDFADPKDTETIKALYESERKNGFNPYVAPKGFAELMKEP